MKTMVIFVVLFTQILVLVCYASDTDTLNLVCRVEPTDKTFLREFGRQDLLFHVDISASKVNGNAATINEFVIDWYDEKDQHTVINRLSGSINIGNSKIKSLVQGQCSKASDRKF
jgi:hypothetical protein